jgi:hypothetical protein
MTYQEYLKATPAKVALEMYYFLQYRHHYKTENGYVVSKTPLNVIYEGLGFCRVSGLNPIAGFETVPTDLQDVSYELIMKCLDIIMLLEGKTIVMGLNTVMFKGGSQVMGKDRRHALEMLVMKYINGE